MGRLCEIRMENKKKLDFFFLIFQCVLQMQTNRANVKTNTVHEFIEKCNFKEKQLLRKKYVVFILAV